MPIQRIVSPQVSRLAERALLICALLVTLAGGAAQAQNKIVPNLAEGPGCLGVAAETCVNWLRSTMNLDEGLIAAAMARRHRVDVNGKPLGAGLVSLSGKLPGHLEPMLIVLHLNPDDTVASAEASLLQNLFAAQTEADYDRSALYDMTARLLGRRCPGLVKLELYRFFENSVKPRIVAQKEDQPGRANGAQRVTLRAAGVPYCTASFTYVQQVDVRGSGQGKTGKGVSGASSYAAIELQ